MPNPADEGLNLHNHDPPQFVVPEIIVIILLLYASPLSTSSRNACHFSKHMLLNILHVFLQK
jgi:hypothetical protein